MSGRLAPAYRRADMRFVRRIGPGSYKVHGELWWWPPTIRWHGWFLVGRRWWWGKRDARQAGR
jgi:hypothetical protein